MRSLGPFLAVPAIALAEPPTFNRALVLPPTGAATRIIVSPDPVAAPIVAGVWTPPSEGDNVPGQDGTPRTWQGIDIAPDGKIEHRAVRGGYAYVPVQSDVEQVVILSAAGHGLVYINGEPRPGDPYSHGYLRIPIALKAGRNDLLFRGSRGGIAFSFRAPESPLTIDMADATLPDVVEGVAGKFVGAAVVINATTDWITGATITASEEGGPATTSPVPPLPPLTSFKAPFVLDVSARKGVKEARILVRVVPPQTPAGTVPPGTEGHATLRVRSPQETRRITFRSAIDGSVQYYALRPATSSAEGQGLILSLHGASVEATSQADAYRALDWANIVCPTNRRPFGFDWEDWGRLDALEVLDLATAALRPDLQRVYLTGHSMGGHGTWHLSTLHPDKFAAIAPSAGWISFWTYSGAAAYQEAQAVERILKRAVSVSDTLAQASNLSGLGVYILHGDRDDNVPVAQARQMRRQLGEFHPDFAYYERPGAGHWWGNECVDWPPLIQFLKDRARPETRDVRRVQFTTPHPGVSASRAWVTVEAPLRPMQPSSVNIGLDPAKRTFSGSTSNVARLTIQLGELASTAESADNPAESGKRVLEPGTPVTIEIDQQNLGEIPWPSAEPRLTLYREGETWRLGGWAPATLKGPHRAGPFKDAFRHNVLLVVGTGGTDEERTVTLARARFDSETFWYRGNASLAMIRDRDFDAATYADRNIVLYGNAATNSAWQALLGDSPVQVRPGTISIGDRTLEGDNLACLFIRPRPGSDYFSVAAVAGTGPSGMRLSQRVPYFQSGVGVPDWIVIGPEVMATGLPGVLGAGFFGNDWSLGSGEGEWAH
ncbi:MAG: prolyl oligopeptidase family serine peptidase [Phycisphaeraceae bacterium]|nr:prolyl oligopeptidase family serine peptidase [Phycisphaeraceae bacterium]